MLLYFCCVLLLHFKEFMIVCRLYVTVITTIRGFGDLFWVDVVEQIDTMTEQVNNFQNQAKKLPKALRDWQAFVDCKKVIDDFLEELPLFQQLAFKAMRPRCAQSSALTCVLQSVTPL